MTTRRHLDAIADRAIEALHKFGLRSKGWTFEWDHAVRRFGSCRHDTRRLTISRHLAALNTLAEAENVILHEIAHALVGSGVGHGRRWVAQAQAIGCTGKRCYDSSVAQPPAKWLATCPACGACIKRNKRRRAACGACCRRHNGGRYDARFAWVWTRR
jgi:predicted SprT family Zn-dependent metalloprotease